MQKPEHTAYPLLLMIMQIFLLQSITDQQKEQLSSLLKQAEAALAKAAANDQVLAAHKDEAVELLKICIRYQCGCR